jgi:hypothetical protein
LPFLSAPPPSADHLVVTSQPPGTITAGTPFGLTVEAVDDSGNVDPSYGGVVTVTANPGGKAFTATASQGVATFSGLILNNTGAYTLQVTASGLTPTTTTSAFNVTPPVSASPPPVIQSQSVLFTQKTNKRGKKVGRPVLQGFMLDFNTAMASSAGDPVNYQIATAVTKRVKRKTVTSYQPVSFQVVYNAATNAVSLLVTGQKFLKGGRITVSASPPNGVSNASGVFLDGNNEGVAGDNAVFTILAKATGITRA